MVTGGQHGLVFYPASHRYKLDGQWVPGVTTILGVIDKPGLKKWAASEVAGYVADNREAVEHLYAAGRGPMVAALKEVPWQKRDDAADRGKNLHDIADKVVRGQEVDVPDHLVPVVENTLRFMEDWRVEPLLVEFCVASRAHRYGGTGDLICRYVHPRTKRGGVGIFDYKSGKRIYSSTAFQNAAYAFAEFYGQYGDEHPLPEVGTSWGVHIRADGYDVYPLKFGPDVYREFLNIRESFDINKRAEGTWGDAGSGYVGLPVEPADDFLFGVTA